MGRPANLVVNILGNAYDLQKALGQATSSLGSFGSFAQTSARTFAVAWTTAAAAVVGLGVSVFKTGVQYNTLNQTAGAAFKTILGSSEAAAAMMDDLKAFAKTSPFPREAFIQATQQMLAFGVESQKVIPYLSAIQDAVAATGGGAQQIQEISSILSKVTSTGKITAETLNQLGERGLDAATLIGQSMGKSGQEIRDAITAGTLDAGSAVDALVAQMGEKFGGAAALVKQTWTGATDRVKGALRDIGSAMAEPFVSSAGGGLAVQWANELADLLRAIEPLVKPLVDEFVSLGGAIGGVSGVLTTAKDAIAGLDPSKAVAGFKELGPALGLVTGGLAAFAGGAASGIPVVGGLLASLASPIGVVVAAIGGLVALSPQLQEVFGGAISGALAAIAPVLPVIAEAFGALAAAVGQALTAAAPLIPLLGQALGAALGVVAQVLAAVAPIIGQLASGLLPQLVALFGALWGAISPLIPIVTSLLTQLVGLVSSALTPLMPIVAEVVAVLASLASTVLSTLLPPLLELIGAVLPPLEAIFAALMPVIEQLAGIFVQLIDTAIMPLIPIVAQLLTALTPLIPPVLSLVAAVFDLISPFLELLSPIIQLIGAALRPLLGIITPLIPIIVQLVGAAVSLLKPIIDLIAPILKLATGALGTLIDWISKLITGGLKLLEPALDGITQAFGFVADAISGVIGWLKDLIGWIGDALGGLGDFLGSLAGAKSASASSASFTAAAYSAPLAGPSPSARMAASLTSLTARLNAIPTSTRIGGATFNITVNAPYGGGDAIARTIRDELNKLDRRAGGVVAGGLTFGMTP